MAIDIKILFETYRKIKRLDFSSVLSKLSSSDYATLSCVYELDKETEGRAEVSVIGKRLGVSAPAASRAVSKLVELDMLSRHINNYDRRYTFIRLTEKGSKALEESTEQLSAVLSEIVSAIGEDQTEQFVEYFDNFLEISDERLEKYRSSK